MIQSTIIFILLFFPHSWATPWGFWTPRSATCAGPSLVLHSFPPSWLLSFAAPVPNRPSRYKTCLSLSPVPDYLAHNCPAFCCGVFFWVYVLLVGLGLFAFRLNFCPWLKCVNRLQLPAGILLRGPLSRFFTLGFVSAESVLSVSTHHNLTFKVFQHAQ